MKEMTEYQYKRRFYNRKDKAGSYGAEVFHMPGHFAPSESGDAARGRLFCTPKQAQTAAS
jgi:hypothetical protein